MNTNSHLERVRAEQNEQQPDGKNMAQVAHCGLGRALGDCQFRAAGCRTLFDAMKYIFPPFELLVELRSRPDLSPALRAWLGRLDSLR